MAKLLGKNKEEHMEITVKETEQCKLSIQYVADAEEILNKRAEVLKAFKKAPVPGFRPGKASMDAIKAHYRTQIEDSLKRALAEDAYHNTLFEKKFRPHGAPKFNSLIMEGGKFTCEFDLNVKPDFELKEYRGFEVPKPHVDMNSVEIAEKMLQELRVRFGTSTPYSEDDFVQLTDNVIIDYEGFADSIKVDALSATGEMLTVGSSQLENFDNNLLGMKVGDEREFDLKVPDNGLPSFSGKVIHFKVTLTMGAKNVPCPLNDELATKMNKKDFSELKEYVAKVAMARVESSRRAALMESVAVRLLDNNKFSVPNWLTLSEAQYLAYSSKLDWDTLEEADKEKYMEMAEKNVRLSLILDRIRDNEPESQLSDQEVFDMIKQNVARTQTGASLDDIIKEMNRTGYLQVLFSRIRDEHTLDFLAKTIKVLE